MILKSLFILTSNKKVGAGNEKPMHKWITICIEHLPCYTPGANTITIYIWENWVLDMYFNFAQVSDKFYKDHNDTTT